MKIVSEIGIEKRLIRWNSVERFFPFCRVKKNTRVKKIKIEEKLAVRQSLRFSRAFYYLQKLGVNCTEVSTRISERKKRCSVL